MNLSFTSTNFPRGVSMDVVEIPIKQRLVDYLKEHDNDIAVTRDDELTTAAGQQHCLYALSLHKEDLYLPIENINALCLALLERSVDMSDNVPIGMLDRDLPLLTIAIQHITSIMIDAIDDHELINLRKQYQVTLTEPGCKTQFFIETASINSKQENNFLDKHIRNQGIILFLCCGADAQDDMVNRLAGVL